MKHECPQCGAEMTATPHPRADLMPGALELRCVNDAGHRGSHVPDAPPPTNPGDSLVSSHAKSKRLRDDNADNSGKKKPAKKAAKKKKAKKAKK